MTESIGFLVNDTARLFRRAFDARAKGSGITALQWRLISHLRRFGPKRQGPLAEMIEVEPITLSRMIDRLAEAGLVERRADPTDRRAWLLHLTPRVDEIESEVRKIADELTRDATHGLAPAEIEQLTALAEHVRANLSRRIDTGELPATGGSERRPAHVPAISPGSSQDRRR